MQAFPKPEGQLFPGVAILLLAAIALVAVLEQRRPGRLAQRPDAPRLEATGIARAGDPVGAACGRVRRGARRAAAHDRPRRDRAPRHRRDPAPRARARCSPRSASRCTRMRARALRGLMWPHGAWLIAVLAAVWLSLGPSPTSMGRPLDLAAPYHLLYALVPGFDGVRVPARFWMVGLLALSVLGGIGAARLSRTRRGLAVLGLAWALCLAEARIDPFVVNGAGPGARFQRPRTAAARTRRDSCRVRGRGAAAARRRARRTAARPARLRPAGDVLLDVPLAEARERLQRLHAGALRPPGGRARPYHGVGRRGVGGPARRLAPARSSSCTKRPIRTRAVHA